MKKIIQWFVDLWNSHLEAQRKEKRFTECNKVFKRIINKHGDNMAFLDHVDDVYEILHRDDVERLQEIEKELDAKTFRGCNVVKH